MSNRRPESAATLASVTATLTATASVAAARPQPMKTTPVYYGFGVIAMLNARRQARKEVSKRRHKVDEMT